MSKTKVLDRYAELLDLAWMGLDEDDVLDFINPFDLMTEWDKFNPDIFLLGLMRQPEYFPLTCKLLLNMEILPFQNVILNELWKRPFPMLIASRGGSKSWSCALYAVLRAIFLQGRKIVIVGSSFRQSKNVMSYVEHIWNNAPVLQDLLSGSPIKSGPKHDTDKWIMQIGLSTIVALPIGTGEKIRGERANDTITDEFASHNPEIFEVVIGGFSVVSGSPVEKVKHAARIKKMKNLGLIDEDQAKEANKQFIRNQQILMGTASYSFNHFAKYHERWHKIIESKGDMNKLREMGGEGFEMPEGFNWSDYSIIRIPVDLLPPHYMDMGQVARAQMANTTAGLYDMEYKCIFSKDSNGFFKASLIQNCIASEQNIESWRGFGLFQNENMRFTPLMKGDPKCSYVIGVDPASIKDNLSVVVLELRETHRRVVYVWTFNKSKHDKLIKSGEINDYNYWSYCASKIRELAKLFNTEHIAIDAQGGGDTIMEALHSNTNMQPGEVPFWPIIEEDNQRDTDNHPGEHILHMVQFANAKWVYEANFGLRKDMEDRRLVFPYFDAVTLMEVQREEQAISIEDGMLEIKELQDELVTIVHTQTPNGTDRWSTPEVKLAGGKKGYQRKDRYSALIMANAIARNLNSIKARPIEGSVGGFAGSVGKDSGDMYNVPPWLKQLNSVSSLYGGVQRYDN